MDPVNGNIITAVISLDTLVDPNVREPRIGEKAYYPGLFTRLVFDNVDERRSDISMAVAVVSA